MFSESMIYRSYNVGQAEPPEEGEELTLSDIS